MNKSKRFRQPEALGFTTLLISTVSQMLVLFAVFSFKRFYRHQ